MVRVKTFLLLPLVSPLLLVGCNVGPNYQPPVVTVRGDALAGTNPTTAPTTAPTTQHSEVSTSAEPVAQWWTTLNDPQLNHLIDRAIGGQSRSADCRFADPRIPSRAETRRRRSAAEDRFQWQLRPHRHG